MSAVLGIRMFLKLFLIIKVFRGSAAAAGIVELVGNCCVYGVVGKLWGGCWQNVGN